MRFYKTRSFKRAATAAMSFGLTSALLLLTGCANIGPLRWTKNRTGTSSALWSPNSGLASEVTGDHACPNPIQENITVQRGGTATTTNTFIGCGSKTESGDFALIAETRPLMVCVFPIEEISQNHIYPKIDLTNGEPLFRCVQLTSSRTQYWQSYGKYSFPNTKYNAAITTTLEDRPRMTQCLKNAQVAQTGMMDCPDFSYGKFR